MNFFYVMPMQKFPIGIIKFFSKLCLIVFCVSILSACSRPIGTTSFTLLSEQTDKIRKHYVVVGVPVEKKDCLTDIFPLIFWVGTGTSPNEDAMLAKILETHNADALIDANFTHSLRFFPIIFSRTCLTVSGTPVKLRGTP